jgi:hypothetical protein
MTSMPKGERDELRRIVRGDFKSLREEIEVRQAELLAEIEKRVAERFMAHESTIAQATEKIQDIVNRANQEMVGVARECQAECDGYAVQLERLFPPSIRIVREQRNEMRRAMIADLEARVAQAKAKMSRQEIELLKRLSVGALVSAEAQAFLAEIPKVSELVPDTRLAELEAQFGPGEG